MQENKYALSFTPILICSLAALFYVYDYFIQVSPAVMTHELMHRFHIGAAGLGILGSIFFYAYASMQIPAGMLLDKFNTRYLLSVAVFISGIGVLIFGMTNSFAVAGLSRFLVGFGSAFSFIGAIYLVSIWFPHRYFAFVAGLIQFAGCVGSIFGEVPLAHAVNHFGWRHTLFVIAIATFILSVLFWWIIRDKPQKITFSEKDKNINLSSWSIFKIPEVWIIACIGFLCWIPVASIGALWGVPYLMKVFHWTNTKAAGYCSLFWLSLGFASPVIGYLSEQFKTRKKPFYICFFAGIVGSLLLIFSVKLPLYMTIVALLLLGLAPAIQALTFGVAKDILPPSVFGTAAGFINMLPIIGGGLSQVMIGFILAALWNHKMHLGVPIYSLHDYQVAMLIMPLCLCLGLFLSYFYLPETHDSHTSDVY